MANRLAVIAKEVDAGSLGIVFDFRDPHTAPVIVMHLGEVVVGNGFTPSLAKFGQ